MSVSYLNGSPTNGQTINGAGQTVPNNTVPEGVSAPYQTFVCSMTGTGTVSASVQIQGSNDGTNWVNLGSALSASGTAPVGEVANTTYKYFQGVVSSITGTAAAVTTTMSV